MITLKTTDSIKVSLSATVAANQLACYAAFRDYDSVGNQFVDDNNATLTNNTTQVTLAAAPSSPYVRGVDFITIQNNDTANAVVTIVLTKSGTDYVLWKFTLVPGDTFNYNKRQGNFITDSNGSIKKTNVLGNSPVTSSLQMTVLGSDVVNNNATADTIADVTGLSFSVLNGHRYRFRFNIFYTSAATTTGSRWSINGPGSPTLLHYRSVYNLTATTVTTNNASAYDIPAASNATSQVAGNIAEIFGVIVPSADGTVIARFASEISSSAITALAGSFVEYQDY